jgi:hypothetical protein
MHELAFEILFVRERHPDCVDPSQDEGDECPEEGEIVQATPFVTDVKMVKPESTQEQGE